MASGDGEAIWGVKSEIAEKNPTEIAGEDSSRVPTEVRRRGQRPGTNPAGAGEEGRRDCWSKNGKFTVAINRQFSRAFNDKLSNSKIILFQS